MRCEAAIMLMCGTIRWMRSIDYIIDFTYAFMYMHHLVQCNAT